MNFYTHFLLLLGFFLLTLSCSEQDLEGPKEHCPELIGEWMYLYRNVVIPESPFILTPRERRDPAEVRINIDDIKQRVNERRQELIDVEQGIFAEFRENGELVFSGSFGSYVNYFICPETDRFNFSDTTAVQENLREWHKILYKDSSMMATFFGNKNFIWLKLD